MKEKRTSLLVGAAIAGIVGFGAGPVSSAPQAQAPGVGLCKGANSCSGTSVWGESKGKNGCQGQGYAFLSKAECQGKKLQWKSIPRAHRKTSGT